MEREPIGKALAALFLHPIETFVYRWNWKSALFSALMRAPIFFSANLTAGWREATGAVVAESSFRAVIAGVYASCTQALRNASPAWAAALVLTVAMPMVAHILEFLLHWLRGTANLKGSMVASVAFTIVSTLFNWYAMRKGALIVGEGAESLGSDLLRMPRLIMGFILLPFRIAWRRVRPQY